MEARRGTLSLNEAAQAGGILVSGGREHFVLQLPVASLRLLASVGRCLRTEVAVALAASTWPPNVSVYR